jgi:hypothetical protein
MNSEQNTPAAEEKIMINDITLSPQQIAEFEKIYGQKPKPGHYWYDKACGLYGIEGQPAMGYMHPGHDYGTLARNASKGNSRVLINNRELTQLEYIMLCQLLGTPVFPGSYWLDAQGNAGMQGSPFPLVNLVMAAQQNAHHAAGGGGDNFWSSRFSAGNSTTDGSYGYVSVPGYGPMDYGNG